MQPAAARQHRFGASNDKVGLAAEKRRHLDDLGNFRHCGGLFRRVIVGDSRDTEGVFHV